MRTIKGLLSVIEIDHQSRIWYGPTVVEMGDKGPAGYKKLQPGCTVCMRHNGLLFRQLFSKRKKRLIDSANHSVAAWWNSTGKGNLNDDPGSV